jgi:hypothetical protein
VAAIFTIQVLVHERSHDGGGSPIGHPECGNTLDLVADPDAAFALDAPVEVTVDKGADDVISENPFLTFEACVCTAEFEGEILQCALT